MAKKPVDPIFHAYSLTATRLDIEFFVRKIGTLPLDLARAFAALHAECSKAEGKGKIKPAHKREYFALVSRAWQAKRDRDGAAAYWAPLFSVAELESLRMESAANQDTTEQTPAAPAAECAA